MNGKEDDFNTQPTATAIMERLQNIEARLAGDIDILAARIERQMMSLRDEVNTRFDSLTAKIEVLNEDTLNVRASQREILKRISALELKAS